MLITYRHDTDVYTGFHPAYNRRAKGGAPLKPRTTVVVLVRFYEPEREDNGGRQKACSINPVY